MRTCLSCPGPDANEWYRRSISIFLSFSFSVHGVEADSFREGGGALCVSCVLAGVSDNEMQQGTKSWGPLFSVLQLHFHSRQSMILPYPLSCVHVCVCVYVCRSQLLCVRVSPPPPVSILHGRSP